MKELMVHVERIVRPIRGDSSKLRIRRELLAHLQASYVEEKSRGCDDAAAVAEAKRRLGDPQTLTRELQASIPAWEQLAVSLFPKSVLASCFAIGILIPVIVAFRTIALVTTWQSRALVVAAILIMELDLLLWLAPFRSILSLRPRWKRALFQSIAAFITQCAWISLIALALTGRAIPTDLPHHAVEYFMLPLCCSLFGMTTVLARLPYKQWHAIDIAD